MRNVDVLRFPCPTPSLSKPTKAFKNTKIIYIVTGPNEFVENSFKRGIFRNIQHLAELYMIGDSPWDSD